MTRTELSALRHELLSLCIDFWYEVDFNGARNAAQHYTDDAVFRSSVREYRGRAALEAFYARPRQARVSIHLVDNFRVVPQAADRVQCLYLLTLHAADGVAVPPSKAAVMVAAAEEIQLRQPDGRWLCESRLVFPRFKDGTTTTG